MEKVIYWDIDTNKSISEQEIRDLYFDLELNDIFSNIKEYKDGSLDLQSQLELIRFARYGDIKDIIMNLEMSWCIPIDIYRKEN